MMSANFVQFEAVVLCDQHTVQELFQVASPTHEVDVGSKRHGSCLSRAKDGHCVRLHTPESLPIMKV